MTPIIHSSSEAFKTLARVLRVLPDALTILDRDIEDVDGMPATCIGASAPTGKTPIRGGDTCTTPVRIDYADKPGYFLDPCGETRPCAHHDTLITLTTVESAAARRTIRTNELASLARKAKKIDDLTADLERAVQRVIGPPAKPALCSRRNGRDGQIVWGDPLCGNIPAADRGGMCERCAEREYRWRKDNNLPARDEAA